MSGPEDTRETGGAADSSAATASPAPPSFGGAPPPAGDPAGPPAGGTEAPPAPRLPPFGLEAPWWAADSTEEAPAPAAADDTAPDDAPDSAAPDAGAPDVPGVQASEGEGEGDAPAAAPRAAAGRTPGTLVAGVGIPRVDSRGAVPAEPLVPPTPSTFTDTDPDGIPAVPPEEPAPAPAPEPEQAVVAAPNGAAAPPRAPSPRPVPSEDRAPAAFERAKEAEKASAAPVLVPDAILPPGVRPPSGESGEHPQAGAGGAGEPPVVGPVHHERGVPPADAPPPPGGTGGPGTAPQAGRNPTPRKDAQGRGNRRTLLIGGGAAAVLAAVVALFALGGSSDDGATREAAERPAGTPSATAPTQPAPPPPAPDPAARRIDDEKTDPKPLEFAEVFPTATINLGGHAYRLDRRSINRDLKYAANGAMLQALQRHQCRKIVRATYLDPGRAVAVTSGIAVMPTKAAALAVSKSGDPATYEWFRGMAGRHTAAMDRAGGYAAATVRGRYVVYAYVQRSDGSPVQPGDRLVKQVAQQFIDHNARPLDARARG
ncbi:hypothetical protein [Actinomadura sediminis]|uniref:Uncharacterized protein n=1 Tax=Actinomadura sediminis TaxID=1038904 RepID=A0ABW3EPM8_9ACTN